ncbi:MAG: hypothetical protein KH112_15705, partial [Sanguibacteroides justesenii]|nr:hypothetical protein [Sanguibacteroides justesenii]
LPPRALSLESGCKDKAIISLFPNILAIIFQVFSNHLHKNVTSKTLGGKLFFQNRIMQARVLWGK